jgi:transposase
MHVIEHESLEELVKRTGQQKQVREHDRFRAVVLARQGKSAPQIAGILNHGVRPVQHWIERYNKGGTAGLMEAKGRGRKPRLAAEQEPKFRQRLEAGPIEADRTCAFHGKDIQRILESEFGALLKLSAVYELLHRLGYSRLCPRPRHPDADPAAQAAFKKTPPNTSKPWQRLIPANTSRSGSRMKHALGNKERSPASGL